MDKQILLTIPLTLLILFSCKENNTNNKQSTKSALEEKVTLSWLGHWYGEGKKETLLHELAREFSLLNQGIEIDLEFPQQMANLKEGEWAFYATEDTITKMIQSDKWPYDMLICDSYLYWTIGYKTGDMNWGEKHLVDFKKEPWFIRSHIDYITKEKNNIDKYGGIAPGAFIEGGWNLFYVSSQVEELLGIKVKTHDMDMNDFLSYAKAVHEYNQTHKDKITFLSFPRKDYKDFLHHLLRSCLQKDKPDNTEEGVEALMEVFKELEKFVSYQPLTEYIKYNGTDDKTLYHDKILFIYFPSWINMFWRKTNPDGEQFMNPCEMPSMNGKKSSIYSGNYNAVFVVPKKAKNRDAAIKFMKFISSEETAEKWIKYSKSPSGLKSRIAYNDFGLDKYSRFSNHISTKYDNRLDEGRIEWFLFQLNKQTHFYVEEIMQGDISADIGLERILNEVERLKNE